MAYPHKWSPISYKSSAGQRKDTGQRPMLYRWTTQPTKCPLCDKEDETSLHLLSKCPATMLCRNALLGAYQLSPLDLRGIHWANLLKFAKTSSRF